MNKWEWLNEMDGHYRICLMILAWICLWFACRTEKKNPDGFLAFVAIFTSFGFVVWSHWFALGAVVKPFNPSMEFMGGK